MLFIIILFYQQNMQLFMWLWYFSCCLEIEIFKNERSQQNMKTENEPHETETTEICQ